MTVSVVVGEKVVANIDHSTPKGIYQLICFASSFSGLKTIQVQDDYVEVSSAHGEIRLICSKF